MTKTANNLWAWLWLGMLVLHFAIGHSPDEFMWSNLETWWTLLVGTR